MALKEDALSILTAALHAADAGNAVRAHFVLPPGNFKRIVLVAVGKAACSMANAVHDILGEELDQTIVVTKHGHAVQTRPNWKLIEAGHPVPDRDSLRAAITVREEISQLGADDLLVLAVSGGASALLSAPAAPVTLKDKQATTDLLLRAGADIHELNTVRKQLSFLKGGRLAALAYPARVLALLLSDVIGDPVDVIGSGLAAPSTSTAADARNVLHRYGLWDEVPESVRTKLAIADEPLPPVNVDSILVGSNRLALEAGAEQARSLGYVPHIVSDSLRGETREVAREQAQLLKGAAPETCLLSGGETTVTVRGSGKGGRNQEFALAIALEIAGCEGRAVLSAGTDGTDGPTDAAGAYADWTTVQRGDDAARHLDNNDSYPFFERIGDLIKTGPTGTNVMDINIMLVRKT